MNQTESGFGTATNPVAKKNMESLNASRQKSRRRTTHHLQPIVNVADDPRTMRFRPPSPTILTDEGDGPFSKEEEAQYSISIQSMKRDSEM